MTKYKVENREIYCIVESKRDKNEMEILALIQTSEPENKWTNCIKIPRGKHICKYCGKIAKGIDEDILCDKCNELFGHTYYSQL